MLIFIGLVAGLVSGLFGVGGGILIVPALVFFLNFSQQKAQGTSLALLLLPVGLFGVLEYYKNSNIDFNATLWIALGFLLGGFLGAKLCNQLDPKLLSKLFALFLMIIAAKIYHQSVQ